MKGILITLLVFAALISADQLYNFGHYTDAAMAMLRHISHSIS